MTKADMEQIATQTGILIGTVVVLCVLGSLLAVCLKGIVAILWGCR